MISIEPLTAMTPPATLELARELFRAYAEFLRAVGGHDWFRFDLLEQETIALPMDYAGNNGEVLLAVENSFAVGCVAYRALTASDALNCCEFKRLFVRPEGRGKGIGELLLKTALEHARQKGYRCVRLDTDPDRMPAAHHLYLKTGFAEYDRRTSDAGSVAFLQWSIEGQSLLSGCTAR